MEDSRPVSESGPPPPALGERWPRHGGERPPLPVDGPRAQMMNRQAGLPVADRIALFEAMSRDAAWAGEAVRIR
jgi:hypothetical protein